MLAIIALILIIYMTFYSSKQKTKYIFKYNEENIPHIAYNTSTGDMYFCGESIPSAYNPRDNTMNLS